MSNDPNSDFDAKTAESILDVQRRINEANNKNVGDLIARTKSGIPSMPPGAVPSPTASETTLPPEDFITQPPVPKKPDGAPEVSVPIAINPKLKQEIFPNAAQGQSQQTSTSESGEPQEIGNDVVPIEIAYHFKEHHRKVRQYFVNVIACLGVDPKRIRLSGMDFDIIEKSCLTDEDVTLNIQVPLSPEKFVSFKIRSMSEYEEEIVGAAIQRDIADKELVFDGTDVANRYHNYWMACQIVKIGDKQIDYFSATYNRDTRVSTHVDRLRDIQQKQISGYKPMYWRMAWIALCTFALKVNIAENMMQAGTFSRPVDGV